MPTTLPRMWTQWTLPNQVTDTTHAARGQQYLFLLSHMRSYSSVLSHVLGSSSNIAGYGETHIKYRYRFDLWRLQQKIRQSTGKSARKRFLLDKILHNHIRCPDEFIGTDNTKALIFVRAPEATLRSIVTMSRTTASDSPYCDPEFACDYYVSRLHQLRVDGLRLGKRALYFDADAVVQNTRRLLIDIGRWLDLDAPLSNRYQTGKLTGTAGFGDPMPNIHAGKILDTTTSTVTEDVALPSTLINEARAAYERCRTTLVSCCTVI